MTRKLTARPVDRSSMMHSGQSERRFQAVDTAPGGLFRTRLKIENLHRNPPIVMGFNKSAHDRTKVDIPHSWSAQVDILGVEMARRRRILSNQVGYGRARLAALGF